jgi:AcrR family transcriptional regulator
MPKLTTLRKQALDEMMREAIFQAAKAVLAEHGVEGMTMDRVAVAAEVAKGSLYHYFSSKKDLLELVHAKLMDPILQNLEDIAATRQSAKEKLAAHLDHLLGYVAEHSRLFKLLFDDAVAQGILRLSQQRAREAGSQRLAEIFRQGIAEGEFRSADSHC